MNDKIFFILYSLIHHSVLLDSLVYTLARVFPYLVVFLGFLFLLMHHEVFAREHLIRSLKQKFREIFFTVFSVVLAWLVTFLLKIFFAEPRPFSALVNITPLFWPADYSFPSAHSAFFMALAVAIFLYHHRAGYFFLISALLIGLARIVSGVHYPLDILAGFLVGGGISYLLIKLFTIRRSSYGG